VLETGYDNSDNGVSANNLTSPSAVQSDFIEPAVKDSSVKRTTVILVASVVLGIAAIWFMNKKAAPASAAAAVSQQQLQIESAIAQIVGIKQQTITKMDQMLSKFYEFSDFKQVLPTNLTKDPFVSVWPGSQMQRPLGDKNGTSASQGLGIDSLELFGIGQSSEGNYCMINEKLLYVGDRIAGLEVAEITPKYVKLTSLGSEHILRFQDK